MSRDLIVLSLAIALGVVVVVVGLRRDLSATTRSGLPRFDRGSGSATETPGLYAGGERRRRPPTPRQLRLLGSFYLSCALILGAGAILSPDGSPINLATAGMFALAGAGFLLRSRRSPRWARFLSSPGESR